MMRRYAILPLLGVLIYLTYSALTTDRFGWDLTITEWVQRVDPEKLGPIPDLLFRMGLKGVAGVTILVVVACLWLKGWRAEAFFVALVVVPDVCNILLRYLIGRPRPTSDLIMVFGGSQGGSFPSGYALHVTLFCGLIIYLSRYVLKPGFLRSALCVVLGLYIPIVGVWLIYDGRHWTSDVLGGYVYGAFYLVVLVWGYRKYVTWRRACPQDHIPMEKLPTLARPFAWIVTNIY